MFRITVILCLILITFGCASRTVVPLIESDLVIPISRKYDYKYKFISPVRPNIVQSVAETESYRGGRPALPSGVQFSANFELSPHLSIGPLIGFQKFHTPDFSMVKIGMIMRLYFIDEDGLFAFTQGGADLPLKRSQFETGSNFRFGIGYPVWKKDNVNLNLSIFYDRHFVNIQNTPARFIIDFPQSYRLSSIGLGFGIRFLRGGPKKKTYHKYLPEKLKL